jgi:signal transduction histidine kinase
MKTSDAKLRLTATSGGVRPAVLLVDDNLASLIALEAVLGSLACRLVQASSGPEALRRILNEDYAVVLMDVRMPELDGFATASFMRQRARSRHTPIIFVTGNSIDSSLLSRAHGLGLVDYVMKPFDAEALRSKVGIFVELFEQREQLRRQDDELRELEKSRARAEAEVRTRENWLAMVAHDLRSPLTSITVSASNLLRHLGDPPEQLMANLERSVGVIQRAAMNMDNLLSDLLDVARLESGRFCIEPTDHDLAVILRQGMELLLPLANEKGLRLEFAFPEASCIVRCERDRILQVLSNLVGNAIKFTPSGGSVTVGSRIHNDYVIVSVQDTGPGISDENLPHIFARHWQAKDNGRLGAGLGLAIAQGIVGAHAGRIWAQSKVGTGTILFFSLPRTESGPESEVRRIATESEPEARADRVSSR